MKVRKYQKEMPWLKVGDKHIDLEFENFKSGDQILNFLSDILNGMKVVDKYGAEFQIETRKDLEDFLNELSNNGSFKMTMGMYFNDSEKKFVQSLLQHYSNDKGEVKND